MKIEFINGSIIKPIEYIEETHRSKRYYDMPIVFSMKGNYTDRNHNFYSTEVLYKAWKEYIGNIVDWVKDEERIVVDVSMQEDFIFIETIKRT